MASASPAPAPTLAPTLAPNLAHAFAALRAQAQADRARLHPGDAVQALLLALIVRLCAQLAALAARHAAARRTGASPDLAQAETSAAAPLRLSLYCDWWVHGRPAPGMRPHPAPGRRRGRMRRRPRPVRGPPSLATPCSAPPRTLGAALPVPVLSRPPGAGAFSCR